MTFRFSLESVQAMTVRERTNWINRGLVRKMRERR